MRQRRVILVESDDALRNLETMVLESLPGACVQSYASPGEAGEALLGEKPAVLIVDLGANGIGGLELVIRTRRQWPGMVVVAMSGKRSRLKSELARLSFVEIWKKPFSVLDLCQRVRSILAADGACDYPPFDVIDYLQMASSGHQSLVLELGLADGREATIEVVDGEVRSSRLGNLRGDSALQAVLALRPVRVACSPLSSGRGVSTIEEIVRLFQVVRTPAGPQPA